MISIDETQEIAKIKMQIYLNRQLYNNKHISYELFATTHNILTSQLTKKTNEDIIYIIPKCSNTAE